jgi:UDP-hydrolysing UDP-N-acetyl-D-glucosamine 2-epimerase
LISDNRPGEAIRSMALLGTEIGEYFTAQVPDMLVVLGDRFELLPVVSAALVMNIPISHISGGDVTEGAIDNQVRHALTKMANLHFPTNEGSGLNLLRMGEEAWRICVAGELGLDSVLTMDYIPKERLFSELDLHPEGQVFCATFHPETIHNDITGAFVADTLKEVLGHFPRVCMVVTAANFDSGGQDINDAIGKMAAGEPRIRFVKSLGKTRYFSLLKYADLVLGNSSSGLVEVQSFNVPVVNIGKRQQGRLANPNVVHVEANTVKVVQAIQYALSDAFRSEYYDKINLYGKGDTAATIANFIASNIGDHNLLMKKTIFNTSDVKRI